MNEDPLQRTTRLFGKAYKRSKRAEQLKDKYQTRFFDLMTKRLSKRTLATRIVPLPPGKEAVSYVKTFYPGWILISILVQEDGGIRNSTKLQIQQDPALLKDEFVNPVDGMVYGRTSAQAAPTLDLDRLQAEDLQLYEDITEPVVITHRVPKPDEDLTDEQIMKRAKYYIPGKISVRLVPPRPANPEELP